MRYIYRLDLHKAQCSTFLGMIKWCSWKGVKLDCPSIFTLFPTNRGMCCSFNMQKADEMFKRSKYREHMKRLSQRDKEFSFDNSTMPEW